MRQTQRDKDWLIEACTSILFSTAIGHSCSNDGHRGKQTVRVLQSPAFGHNGRRNNHCGTAWEQSLGNFSEKTKENFFFLNPGLNYTNVIHWNNDCECPLPGDEGMNYRISRLPVEPCNRQFILLSGFTLEKEHWRSCQSRMYGVL